MVRIRRPDRLQPGLHAPPDEVTQDFWSRIRHQMAAENGAQQCTGEVHLRIQPHRGVSGALSYVNDTKQRLEYPGVAGRNYSHMPTFKAPQAWHKSKGGALPHKAGRPHK